MHPDQIQPTTSEIKPKIYLFGLFSSEIKPNTTKTPICEFLPKQTLLPTPRLHGQATTFPVQQFIQEKVPNFN